MTKKFYYLVLITLFSFNTFASEVWLECGKGKKPYKDYPQLLIKIFNIEKNKDQGATLIEVLKVRGSTGMTRKTFDAVYDLKDLHFIYQDFAYEQRFRINRETLKISWTIEEQCYISNQTEVEKKIEEIQSIQFEKNKI